jgi:hypothetical protein
MAAACAPDGVLYPFVVPAPGTPGVLRLRHPYVGHLVLEHCSLSGPLAELAADVCLSVANLVSKQAISRQTLEYKIARALMDIESVRRFRGTDDVDDWYEDLESAYAWNARFWEQRALGLRGHLDRAYSFARRAVSKSEDAFTLNTLGTVLMWRAVDKAPRSAGTRLQYWTEAVDALARSRDRGRNEFEHPYVTFFSYTAQLISIPGTTSEAPTTRIPLAVEDWRSELLKTDLVPGEEVARLLAPFPSEWTE